MSAAKPATSLPVNRHFDCMKRCPMDCAKACKRLAYPRLVAHLRAWVAGCGDPAFSTPEQYTDLLNSSGNLLRDLEGPI